jgi:UrcA family protein
MHKKIAFLKASMVLAAIGFSAASGAAVAAELDEIVVQSPKISKEYSPWSRTWEERYSANVRVGYSDLNLTNNADVQAFRARVKTAAAVACQKLNQVILVADQACRDETFAAAQPRLQAAVEAAMHAEVPAKQEIEMEAVRGG